MKKCIASLALMLIFISCDTSDVENEAVVAINDSQFKNERVYFKNWNEFGKEYLLISKLSSEEIFEENELFSIIQKDESREILSPALNKFLNSNNEFQVGNEIMWFKDGEFYSFNVNEEENLPSLKLNYKNILASKEIIIGNAIESNILKNASNARISIGTNGGIDARYQRQFRRKSYYDCGSTVNQGTTTRDQKYVHELYSESGNGWNALYLRLKLEWNPSSGRWRAAGEKRNIEVNISGNAVLTTTLGVEIPSTYGTFTVNRTFNCSQDQTILLYNAFANGSPYWHTEVTGTIFHQINGDVIDNAWTNYVNW